MPIQSSWLTILNLQIGCFWISPCILWSGIHPYRNKIHPTNAGTISEWSVEEGNVHGCFHEHDYGVTCETRSFEIGDIPWLISTCMNRCTWCFRHGDMDNYARTRLFEVSYCFHVPSISIETLQHNIINVWIDYIFIDSRRCITP